MSLIAWIDSTFFVRSLCLLRIHRLIVSAALRIPLCVKHQTSSEVANAKTCVVSFSEATTEAASSSSNHLSGEVDQQSRKGRSLERVFQLFDENSDGVVCIQEVHRGLKKLGLHIPEEQLGTLVNSVSRNGVGHLRLDEFEALYKSVCEDQLLEEEASIETAQDDESSDLLEAFRVFDKDGDGFISAVELQAVLSSLGFAACRDLSFCQGILRRVDANSDGQIDYSEFKQMMSGM